MMTRVIAALGLFLMVGCATQLSQELPATHPANPAATEAPRLEPSTVLALGSADPIRANGEAESNRDRSEHAGEHSAHGQSMAMNMGSEPSSGPQLYMCPMHPEVTSTNPNDRCPECSMKINKPVNARSGSSVTDSAAPAEDHSAHHHHHGGHGQ